MSSYSKFIILSLIYTILLSGLSFYHYQSSRQFQSNNSSLSSQKTTLETQLSQLEQQYQQIQQEYQSLQSQDQIKINQELESTISQINKTFTQANQSYEDIVDLKAAKLNTNKIDTKFASILSLLSKQNYASAASALSDLKKDISTLQSSLSQASIPANVIQKNTPPDSGYSRQTVTLDDGRQFLVDIISANLSNTKVIVDTVSDSDCRNDCPVKSVGELAARSGAFAAINGPYFCPASYPSCADKKNSFDTLLMNKSKTYFNSDNNVYSSVPAAIFSSTSRFVTKSSEWGRDTSVDSVIANQPLLVFNGQSQFNGDDDPKKSSVGSRSFIAATDSAVYIGIVKSASVADAAKVIAKMGIKNALNLDSGGSTALWTNGKYVAGPGRDLPFAILLVKR